MQELKIGIRQFGESEDIIKNIEYALSLGLPEFKPFPIKHDGTACIIGSGPSLNRQLTRIQKERGKGRPIVSINGAHDYLIEHGITPDYFLTVDPRGMPQNFKHHNEDTTYLLASRVNPNDFNTLKGRRIILWHSLSEEGCMAPLAGKLCIGGGTTSGLRAISFFYVLGFRKFHLYGFDSCLGTRGEKHIDDAPLGERVKRVSVIVDGEEFICNAAMAAQADNFQDIYASMPGISIKSFGKGLITAIIKARQKQGLNT